MELIHLVSGPMRRSSEWLMSIYGENMTYVKWIHIVSLILVCFMLPYAMSSKSWGQGEKIIHCTNEQAAHHLSALDTDVLTDYDPARLIEEFVRSDGSRSIIERLFKRVDPINLAIDEWERYFDKETVCSRLLALLSSRASLLTMVAAIGDAGISDDDDIRLVLQPFVFTYIYDRVELEVLLAGDNPMPFCKTEQIIQQLDELDTDILAENDPAVLLEIFVWGESSRPMLQSVEQSTVAYTDFTWYSETHLESETVCYPLHNMLSSRAALLLHYSLIDPAGNLFTEDEERWILRPAVIAYMLDRIYIETLIESELDNISEQDQYEDALGSNTNSSNRILWSHQGQGNTEMSVDVFFPPGIYRFELVQPAKVEFYSDWGKIKLVNIVDTPEGCFMTPNNGEIRFPNQLRIKQDCLIFTTLTVIPVAGQSALSSTIGEQTSIWEISISKLD